MGCDIHIRIERQAPSGLWERVPHQELYCFGPRVPVAGVPVAPECFTNRNYDLFGILADVRNGTGFAGVTTGHGWPSIAADRGLPPDMSQPVHSDEDEHWLGDHSFTWVTLAELEAFDWQGTVSTKYGVVDAETYEKYRAVGRPPKWSGEVSGPGVVTYDPRAYEAAKAAGTLTPKPFVRMTWTSTAYEATCGWFLDVRPWLRALAEDRPLRLILGFDS